MDQMVVLLIAAGVLIIAYVLLSTFVFSRKGKDTADPLYTAALEALVRSEEENAVQFLIESAKKNPSSLSPFLVLGDIFRKQGDVRKAVKIHHELSIRPKLKKDDIERIFRSLTLDYLELEKYQQAIQTVQKLLSLNKRDAFALNSLLGAYEGQGDWNKAVETAKTISNRVHQDWSKFLALYHAYVGWRVFDETPEKAEKLFKKSLSLDPDCLAASVILGDIYIKDYQYDKAIAIWSKMLDREPSAIHHVVDRLEKAYFESGNYSQMMEVYERLHKEIPTDVVVLLGMAQMSLKKGDSPAAARYVEEAREVNPRNQKIYQVYLEIQDESGDPKPALDACREYFGKVVSENQMYLCSSCGYSTERLIPRCPDCGNWEFELIV
jgi:lipopolysaccharide biosynthesis regulator YciM